MPPRRRLPGSPVAESASPEGDSEAAGMSFNVAVDWREEGVSLGSVTLEQSAPVTVGKIRQQLRDEFQLPELQQTLATPEGRVLDDDNQTISGATVLLLSEKEEVAPPSEVHVRWDEQGVALGNAAVAVSTVGISARELKDKLEARFQVPASAQYLRTVTGQAIDDEDKLLPQSEVVMCEQFCISVKIIEYEQEIDSMDISAASSMSVADLKRRLSESLRLPALQLRLRSTKGITLQDTEMLSGACTIRCSDKLKFVLRVRWVEQEVVLDPKAAKWAGTVTLAETVLRCAGAQPIASLKEKLQAAFGVPVEQQRLGTADGRLLMEGQVVTGEQEILLRVVGEALLVAEPVAPQEAKQEVSESEPEAKPGPSRIAEGLEGVLDAAGLSAYSAAFAEEDLTLELLRQLSNEPGALRDSLEELGVPSGECEARAATLVASLQSAAEAASKAGALTVIEPLPWAGPGIEGGLAALLNGLGLGHLLPTFEAEELGLPLLQKMAEDPAECAMVLEEVGVGAVSRDKLIAALSQAPLLPSGPPSS